MVLALTGWLMKDIAARGMSAIMAVRSLWACWIVYQFSLSVVCASLPDPSWRWCMTFSIHYCQQRAMVISPWPVWHIRQNSNCLNCFSLRHTLLANDATNTPPWVRMESKQNRTTLYSQSSTAIRPIHAYITCTSKRETWIVHMFLNVKTAQQV